jgi:hypothetical protein
LHSNGCAWKREVQMKLSGSDQRNKTACEPDQLRAYIHVIAP